MRSGLWVLLAIAIAIPDARACVTPPHRQHAPIEDLIATVHTVVLAQATNARARSPFETIYTLETRRVISGRAVARYEISGLPRGKRNKGLPEWNFEDHQAKVFWEDDWAGRVFNSTDCKLHPSFAIGGIYLIFLGEVPHVKGFERIHDVSKDEWLKYVESRFQH